ncbi:unnamed protein product, partial [Ectocarpus fasciculatus]
AEPGLPRVVAPPDVAVGKVTQLWGLHHAVEAAMDSLLCHDTSVRTSFRLGRRIVGQLADMAWPGKVRPEVTLDHESGTLWVERSTKSSIADITDALETELPCSIQLVDMIDAAVMRNLAVPAALQALA